MKRACFLIMMVAVAALTAGCGQSGLFQIGSAEHPENDGAPVITVNADGVTVDLAGFGFAWNKERLSVAVVIEDNDPAVEDTSAALVAELLAEKKGNKPQVPPIESAMIESSW